MDLFIKGENEDDFELKELPEAKEKSKKQPKKPRKKKTKFTTADAYVAEVTRVAKEKYGTENILEVRHINDCVGWVAYKKGKEEPTGYVYVGNPSNWIGNYDIQE